jgi:tartrate-resistant acid phosphatase type 5
MGDWGGLPWSPFSTAMERAIADQMAKVASNIDSQFLLALGDNFYYDGVTDIHDPRFHVSATKNCPKIFTNVHPL